MQPTAESSALSAEEDVLGLVDPSRKVRRPPLVGMQFLHQGTVSAGDVVGARPRLQAKDLMSLLWRHWSAARKAPAPRVRTTLRVFTPAGLPAVKIRSE